MKSSPKTCMYPLITNLALYLSILPFDLWNSILKWLVFDLLTKSYYSKYYFSLKITTWSWWQLSNCETHGNEIFLHMFLEFGVMFSCQGFQCFLWDFFGVDLLSIILINLLGFLITIHALVLGELFAINLFFHEDNSIGICEWGDNGWVLFLH
jgi:hypothetical protein